MNFISVYYIVNIKNISRSKIFLYLHFWVMQLLKLHFVLLFQQRSNKAFYSRFIFLPTFINENGVVTFADGRRSYHFLCDSVHKSFTGLFTFCGEVCCHFRGFKYIFLNQNLESFISYIYVIWKYADYFGEYLKQCFQNTWPLKFAKNVK